MKSIHQLLEEKGQEVFSVAPDNSVFEAIRRMAEREVGALLVMDGDRTVGIISERDYARKVILKNRSSRETRVEEIMTREVICGDPEMAVDAGLDLMTRMRIRHLPIRDDSRLLGVVSIGDLVKSIIGEQRYVIDQLEQYIRS